MNIIYSVYMHIIPNYIAFSIVCITKTSNLVQSLNFLLAHHHKLLHLGLKAKQKKNQMRNPLKFEWGQQTVFKRHLDHALNNMF